MELPDDQPKNNFSLSEDPKSKWAQALLESVSEGILIVDDRGVIHYANSQVEALFGWPRQALIGQVVDILLPPAFRQVHIEYRELYFEQPVPRSMGIGRELMGRRKDGSDFPIEISLRPFNTGDSTHILCLITDISRWVETSAHLRASLEQFESLFKAFPLSTYVWRQQEEDFILVNYNDADQPAANAAIHKFIGRGLRVMFPQGDQMVRDIERCYQEKTTFSREYKEYRVPYTSQVKDLNVTYVFCDPDLVMVIFDDMTVLHTTIGELKKLSSAVEQTADAVFITDKNGIIEYANLGFEQMTGFMRAEAVGNNPRIIKSGQMPPEYYALLWKTVLGGDAFRSQTINRRRNGEIFIAEQTITPMKDPKGEVTHFISVLKDMTDRIRSQEMETEHRLAGRVQMQLFPIRTPEIPGYDIAGAVFPARHTSGDCFDFVSMPDNSLGIVVADVCDHGMGSALIMAKTQAHLHSIMHYESDPRIILGELNRQMQPDLIDSMFITIFLAILDPSRHLLEYANAGNPPTFILDQQGEIIHELRTDGLPIGLFPDLDLRQHEPVLLPPGSLAVFLTDGFHEAFDENGGQFGFERMLDVIRRYRLSPAQEIVDRVKDAVQEFSGFVEKTDDQTIIICKRVG